MNWGRVLLTGATSAIGRALGLRLAQEGCELVLLARDSIEVSRVVSDLRLRSSARVEARSFDATDTRSHEALIEEVTGSARLDGAILCHGYMVDQTEAVRSWSESERIITINYSSYVALCSPLAQFFCQQGHGFLCAISSVAGDRGRQSNYIYGSAKGALTIYLQGLRNAVHSHDVHVLTVKPGFVDTAMTWGQLNPNSVMVAAPEKVAADIVTAIKKRRDIVYTPWFWRWIMLILKWTPETIFKRLKL